MTETDNRRPAPGVILSDPVHCLAFGLGTGLSPLMPGTVGTLVGIPLYLLMMGLSVPIYLALTAVLFVVGIYLCGESARRLNTHDHPGIVWDEIVGYLVTMLPVLPALSFANDAVPTWQWLLIGFVVFRVFDILKPPPIKQVDQKVHGGFGIMLDDLLAAVYAAVVMGVIVQSGWLGPAAG